MAIRIVTDSTCDLPRRIVSQHSITVIPLAINVGKKSFLDGVDLTHHEFYAQLPNFTPHPKTGAPEREAVQTHPRHSSGFWSAQPGSGIHC